MLNITFWGVRGSVGVAGPATNIYGGHTSCIEIEANGRRIIVDAGTGIVPLGAAMDAKAGDHFDILLTHLHHDHVLGLMMFAPLFVPGVTVDIYCGDLGGRTPETDLRRMFSPPLFPLTFDEIPSTVRFVGFSSGETLRVGGVEVHTCPLNHPDGATGYRIGADTQSAVILTDMEHTGDAAEPSAELIAFCKDTDLIVYDAAFDDCDYPRYRGWGHSTWEAGMALARASNTPRLACFHHAPEYDDARLSRMEAKLKSEFPGGFFAREGQSLKIGAGRPDAPAPASDR